VGRAPTIRSTTTTSSMRFIYASRVSSACEIGPD
jgi:hypothetical protein